MEFKETTKRDFFEIIGKQDVHPKVLGNFPYSCLWQTRNGVTVGKSVDRMEKGVLKTKYYLPK